MNLKNRNFTVALIAAVMVFATLIFGIVFMTKKGCEKEVELSVSEKIQRCSTVHSMDELLKMAIPDVAKFISTECGLPISTEELIYTARIVYFEVAFRGDQRSSAVAVSNVILNRHLFGIGDKGFPVPNNTGKNQFHLDGDRIWDVVINNSGKRTRHGNITGWAFSSFWDFPAFFYPESIMKDDNGNPVVKGFAEGKRNWKTKVWMDAKKSDIAYEALVSVLTGHEKDNTCSALFYKNTAVVPGVVWNGKMSEVSGYRMKWVHEVDESCPEMIEGHHFYTVVPPDAVASF